MKKLYSPLWLYSLICSRVAYDYLSENAVPLNAFATKYAEGISKHYENISSKSLKIVSEEMLKFLNELEAGEKAEVILNNYSFFVYIARIKVFIILVYIFLIFSYFYLMLYILYHRINAYFMYRNSKNSIKKDLYLFIIKHIILIRYCSKWSQCIF